MNFKTQLGTLIESVWRAVEPRSRRDFRVIDGQLAGLRRISQQDIYQMYNRAMISGPVHLQELNGFLSQLQKLEKHCKSMGVQRSNYLERLSEFTPPINDRGVAATLWDAFFHCFSSQKGSARRRIYVHAARDHGVGILKKIVELYGNSTKGKGLLCAKIAGPGIVRDDTIVVYLTDDAAVKRVVATLETVPASQRERGVPAGTKEVSKGIGIADEPSRVAVWEEFDPKELRLRTVPAVSFGDFYSKLLHMCLCYPDSRGKRGSAVESNQPSSLRELKANVATAQRVCGIDPVEPHRISKGEAQLHELLKTAQSSLARRRPRR